MNFRVVATVPKKTARGTVYDHTIYVGEFDPNAYDELNAREYARKKIREVHPSTLQYSLSVEDVLPIVFHH